MIYPRSAVASIIDTSQVDQPHATWPIDADRLNNALSHLGGLGLVVLVKVDGERERLTWTVVVTGRQLTGTPIRRDGPTLESCLGSALTELETHLPGAVRLPR